MEYTAAGRRVRRLVLVRAEEGPIEAEPYYAGWSERADALAIHRVPGDHSTMVRPPHVTALAALVSRLVREARGEPLRKDSSSPHDGQAMEKTP